MALGRLLVLLTLRVCISKDLLMVCLMRSRVAALSVLVRRVTIMGHARGLQIHLLLISSVVDSLLGHLGRLWILVKLGWLGLARVVVCLELCLSGHLRRGESLLVWVLQMRVVHALKPINVLICIWIECHLRAVEARLHLLDEIPLLW